MGVLVVPPELLDSWIKEDIDSYTIWKSNRTTKNRKKDHIEYCKNINRDFNMDKIYDDIDAGLSALERFCEFIRLFPSYDAKLNKIIEAAYAKEN